MAARLLLSTLGRVLLWGGGLGAVLGMIYGVAVILLSSSPDGAPIGLAYGCYLGLFAGLGLGLLNGVALGVAFVLDRTRAADERTWVRRYTMASLVFNVAIMLAGIFAAHLLLPNFSLGGSWPAVGVNGLVTSAPLVLAVSSATWVDARLARWYAQSPYYKRTGRSSTA